MGWLLSPCACSRIGPAPCLTVLGNPMNSVVPRISVLFLQNHAVLDYRNVRTCAISAVGFERGGGVDYVVNVPFPGFTHGVGKRSCLFVNTSRHAVDVCLVVVVVKHLHFVHSLKVNAAVASKLVGTFYVFRHTPFNV